MTGKTCTCGHQKVAFALARLGGLWSQANYIRKIIGTCKLWSYLRGGLWTRGSLTTGSTVIHKHADLSFTILVNDLWKHNNAKLVDATANGGLGQKGFNLPLLVAGVQPALSGVCVPTYLGTLRPCTTTLVR